MNTKVNNTLKVPGEGINKLLGISRLVIDGKIDLVEASRLIVQIIHEENIENDELFFPIRGFESECDIFPPERSRKLWDKEYLKKLDKKRKEYIHDFRDQFIEICKSIILKYSIK